jgi:hypothetical protein
MDERPVNPLSNALLPTAHAPHQNHLLAALPATAFERLQPHLELVPRPLGEVLQESGGSLAPRLFPDHLDRARDLARASPRWAR